MNQQLLAVRLGMAGGKMAIIPNTCMPTLGTNDTLLGSIWSSSVRRSALLLILVTAAFSGGCSLRYSVAEHEAFSVKGNCSIEGTVVDEWQCNRVSLHPNTEYGLAVVKGDIRSKAVDPRYRYIVRSVTINDGSFVFEDLPEGKYLLVCVLTKKEWMTGKQLAQAGSPIALDRLARGEALTVKTRHGTFHRDAKGKWTPSGAMAIRSKGVYRALILSGGQRQEVSMP